MSQNHYATLGVTPTANAAAIRAAYLALMREYHPDKNASPAAVDRAQAIIAAFKVLGDFDRRSHYDWDQRRAREAAAVLAAKRPRKFGSGAVAAGTIGLAAVAGLVLLRTPQPRPVDPPVTAVRTAPVAQTKPRPEVKRVAVEVERAELVRVATIKPAAPKPNAQRAPVAEAVRVAAVKAPAPRVVPVSTAPRLVKATARPVQQVVRSASTDLASLDQFVMNFYGQSWRYGDAPKRASLVQSRDTFVARRGVCRTDACKREAYLRLMRDVSEIVETGQPTTR